MLAFLQNQWFKDPDKARQMLDRHVDDIRFRRRLIATCLFAGCPSGRVLKHALGSDLAAHVVWEESSPHIGGQGSAYFPPDPLHQKTVILQEQPDIILVFGKVAMTGLRAVDFDGVKPFDRLGTGEAVYVCKKPWDSNQFCVVLHGPHPASREDNKMSRLHILARNLRKMEIRKGESHVEGPFTG